MPKRYQGSDAWLAERRSGYGASDAPILIEGDEAAWQQLHGEKLGIVPGREATETMDLGKRLEQPIAELVAERIGVRLVRVNRLIRHPDYPYVFASLDRRIRSSAGRPVEIKKWGFKSDAFGPENSDIVPLSMLYQAQQQAAVTGADAVDLWVLFAGSKLERFSVGRDEALITEIIGLETAAWRYVERGEMPPWPGAAPKRVILSADEVEIDAQLAEIIALYDEANAAAKASEEYLDHQKERIRGLLADAGGAKGSLPDGRRATIAYRPQSDREVVAWELVAKAYRAMLTGAGHLRGAEDLDAIESMFTTTKPGIRPLRISIKEGTQ